MRPSAGPGVTGLAGVFESTKADGERDDSSGALGSAAQVESTREPLRTSAEYLLRAICIMMLSSDILAHLGLQMSGNVQLPIRNVLDEIEPIREML